MSAKDLYHDNVVNALVKEGWTITHDPLRINFLNVELLIDLGAERVIAAERNDERIAVEIKSFISGSAISQFHLALGQYLDYYEGLLHEDPERTLYLAVPLTAYDDFFRSPFGQHMTQRYQIKLMVYDEEGEVIVTWLP